jgi:serine acetyltransferase
MTMSGFVVANCAQGVGNRCSLRQGVTVGNARILRRSGCGVGVVGDDVGKRLVFSSATTRASDI